MSNEEVGGSVGVQDKRDWPASPPSSLTDEDGVEVLLSSSWTQDGDLALQLDRRWVLWHEFMNEHAHLDAWLRLAEQAAGSPGPAQVTYATAKKELRKLERLQSEAGLRLVQLDGLTRQNRTLTGFFDGAMRARLLALTRDGGRRWDDVTARLDTITRRLERLVAEREEFEEERAELGLWLADLDIRLTEVEHQTGNACHKLKELQAFQAAVCVNSRRVSVLLERGEIMMQRCEPPDAEEVESELLQLLQHCSHMFNRMAQLHTRLLSMRLVFEDDCMLSQAPDSGCPSESVLEDEGALDKHNFDLPAYSYLPQELELSNGITSLRECSHEHLGLEWDPSVDIGTSPDAVSPDDTDASCFSANTGRLKRRRYLGSLCTQSDIINDISNQEVDSLLPGWLDHTHLIEGHQWDASTPDKQVCEPVSFDGGRVRAWLGVQSSTPLERTSCSRAVQTEIQRNSNIGYHDNKPLGGDLFPSCPVLQRPQRDTCQSSLQSKDDRFGSDEIWEPKVNSQRWGVSSLVGPALPYLLMAMALTLLACLAWALLQPPCHRSNRLPLSHLALRYVNGPPPT